MGFLNRFRKKKLKKDEAFTFESGSGKKKPKLFFDEVLEHLKEKGLVEIEKWTEEDFIKYYEGSHPRKHAIWRGKPTKAYIKWKKDNYGS